MSGVFVRDCVINNMNVHQKGDRASHDESKSCVQVESDDGPISASNADTDLYYQGKSGKPKVLIIANSKFDKSCELKGHKRDLKELKKMWKEDFKCCVLEEKNLTSVEIIAETQHLSEQMSGDEKYCAVFVLSHGKYGDRIVGTDEETVKFDDILSIFDNRNVKLQSIPKLFFFQCCRGDRIDRGAPASTAATTGIHQRGTLPEVSDTLIMFATQQGNVSIVDENGSWIVKELIQVFKSYHREQDLTSMLTIINKRVSEKIVLYAPDDPNIVGTKCMSEYRSTLTAKLSLTPN